MAIDAMSAWISVEDQQPQEGERVLICDADEEDVDVLVFSEGCFWQDDSTVGYVTHWMPLPDPVKRPDAV